jgi:hypothetical protein
LVKNTLLSWQNNLPKAELEKTREAERVFIPHPGDKYKIQIQLSPLLSQNCQGVFDNPAALIPPLELACQKGGAKELLKR